MMTGLNSILAAQEATVHSQIATAVAVKQIGAMEQQGQAAADLLDAAVKLSKSLTNGSQFDAVA